jgi:hypothetical protein
MKKLIAIFGIIFSLNSFGQDFHDQVKNMYNFTPHLLSSKEQQALYPKLDKFFDLVIKNKNKYLEPLRTELKHNDNNPYFYFDGGLLLQEISQDESDIQLIADALIKVDLRDVPPDVYLGHLLKLSIAGANVIDAALNVLDDSTFHAFIPQHALTLNYGEGLEFILPRYQHDLYLDKLISKFNHLNSNESKISCLDLFIYANCCEADEFLTSLKSDNKQPQKIRDKVEETIKLTTVVQKEDNNRYLQYYNKRKEALINISDEVADELNDLTLEMRKSYSCKK